MTARILIVEDDENLRLALADNLEAEGYAVSVASTGAEAESRLAAEPVDLVVLDLMLPDTDGYRLCEKLRAAGTDVRILMLTARSLDEDVVRGFDVGADDYVAKPYRLALLLARIRALLRRGGGPRGAPSASVLRFDRFSLDGDSRIVEDDGGRTIDLTRKEFDLLKYLLENRGRALDRPRILEDVWGADVVVDERTVDNFVSSVKKKLGWTRASRYRIATVRGVGYRLELDE
jgi:DNA-binding response OmpR family regulator